MKLSEVLLSNNVTILGTDVDAIDEIRGQRKISISCSSTQSQATPNSTVKNLQEAIKASQEIGFPIVVRPSYVLGGRAMELVHTEVELEKYLKEAVEVSDKKPILLDGYLTDAIEVDVDVISDGSDMRLVVFYSILNKLEFIQATLHAHCLLIASAKVTKKLKSKQKRLLQN